MPYTLKYDDKSVNIAGYLLVCPFDFESDQGKLQIKPNKAVAFVNIVTVQMQKPNFPAASSKLPPMSDFSIWNSAGKQILEMRSFGVDVVCTPASLDMNRAIWVLSGGKGTEDVAISFEPAKSKLDGFAGSDRNTYLWGAELKSDDVLLQASLSAPVYDRDIATNKTWIRDYFAFGPANSTQSGKSLFTWVTSHGRPLVRDSNDQVEVEAGDNLSRLDVEDKRRLVTNEFFGSDERDQVAEAEGALFIMNGAIVHTAWRPLWRTIREVASDGDSWDCAQRLPVSKLDQTVAATAETVVKRKKGEKEAPKSPSFNIDTPDYEGIVLWGLRRRSDKDSEPPMHY